MAENQPTDNKTKKRLVKNPETFRERAIKASEEGDKPKRFTRAKTASSKVAAPVFRPIGSAGRKIGGFGPFKFLRKPFRIIGRVLLPKYVRGSWAELRQVTWPNWEKARQLTFAVILFASVFGVIVAVVDFGLDRLFRDILLK
ncbi:MAG: preprotein translocase subunit SecE [Patescibacteria group bacterium]|nr:preprotein translocase subunit SecE [Patescibacteria group bacterium]